MGIQFLVQSRSTKERQAVRSVSHRILKTVLGSVYVGFVCGFKGTGGGLLMLILLTVFMGYDLQLAVGTSTFIMTFTALLGAGVHFAINGIPEWSMILLCVSSTAIAATLSSMLANRIRPNRVKAITGALLLATGLLTLGYNFL